MTRLSRWRSAQTPPSPQDPARSSRRRRPRGRLVGPLALAALLSSSLLPMSAQADTSVGPVFVDGQAQVVPGFSDPSTWIRQQLWVETEFDSDGDGVLDRMHVDVTRPAQTEGDLKVPVVYETSPYYAGGSSTARQYFWDVRHELGQTPPPRTSPPSILHRPDRTAVSTSLVSTWVPRGFAVVHSDSVGTGLSRGCPTVGGENEALAPKAVVDWLNGRAKGYTSVDGDEEVSATGWSTGKVGMMGTSYNGTLPLAAATTGVDGLEAIIPVAPNTSYYHYYRSNGLVRGPGGYPGEDIDFLFDYISSGYPDTRDYCAEQVRVKEMNAHQDRTTGDYNDFWEGRDYLHQLDDVRAATLMAHGFNDWNVMPEHSLRISEALKDKGVPVQTYYHQGGHGGNPPMRMMNRWFSRYLYGIENGVEQDARAWITREAAACQVRTATLTQEAVATDRLKVADSSELSQGATLSIPITAANGTVSTLNRVIASVPDATTVVLESPAATGAGQRVASGSTLTIACSAANPTPYADYPNPQAQTLTFRPSAGGSTAGGFTSLALPATGAEQLVDAGHQSCNAGALATGTTDGRLLYTSPTLTAPLHLSGTPRVTVRLAADKSAANLSVAVVRLPFTSATGCTSSTRGATTGVITRGWADPQNHRSLRAGEPLVPGTFYDVTFDLQPTDKVLQPGEQLGLMIFSTDPEFTVMPEPGTTLSVDLAGTSADLPVVGGAFALGICEESGASTIRIGGLDSGIPDRQLAGSCRMSHHLMQDQPWRNHGQFVKHVGALADEFVSAGLITPKERGALVSTAARSKVGR